MQEEAPRAVWEFVRENPGEALQIVLNKVVMTYAVDDAGAELVRGHYGKQNWFLDESTWRRLALISNVYWWLVAIPFLIGLSRVRSWPISTIVLVFGPVLTWFALHLVFIGGARGHVPEILLYALVAAGGIELALQRAGLIKTGVQTTRPVG